MKKIIAFCFSLAITPLLYAQTQRNPVTENIYQTLKRYEKDFPRPELLDTLLVGTYDATSGSFEGLKSAELFSATPKPHTMHLPALYTSRTATTALKFKFIHSTGFLYVFVNGKKYTANPGESEIVIPVGVTVNISWKVSQGAKSHTDDLKVSRMIIGSGAYTISYIPIGILYAPPFTNSPANESEYSTASAIGTTITLSNGVESFESRPKMTALNVFNQVLDAGIGSTADNPDPHVKAANRVLSLIKGAIGNESVTTSIGQIHNDELEITARSIVEQSFRTPSPTRGYGHTDVFFLLKNPRILWTAINGQLYYTVLDFESVVQITSDDVKQSADPAISALISMNPMSVATTKPNAPRYSPIASLETRTLYPGNDLRAKVIKQQITSRRVTNCNMFSEVHDYTAGYLSFVGIGNETKTVKQNFTQSTIQSVSSSNTEINSIYILNGEKKPITIAFYYDNVFGGIVAYRIPDNQATLSTGRN
jgi:hypothetical protein